MAEESEITTSSKETGVTIWESWDPFLIDKDDVGSLITETTGFKPEKNMEIAEFLIRKHDELRKHYQLPDEGLPDEKRREELIKLANEKGISVEFSERKGIDTPGGAIAGGMYSEKVNTVYVNTSSVITLEHELTHALQHIEAKKKNEVMPYSQMEFEAYTAVDLPKPNKLRTNPMSIYALYAKMATSVLRAKAVDESET